MGRTRGHSRAQKKMHSHACTGLATTVQTKQRAHAYNLYLYLSLLISITDSISYLHLTSTHNPSSPRRFARNSIGRQLASSELLPPLPLLDEGARRPKLLSELPRGAMPAAESPSCVRHAHMVIKALRRQMTTGEVEERQRLPSAMSDTTVRLCICTQ
jgi:hypothetical protein